MAERQKGTFRIGIGFDAHPLGEGRPLVLGGVTIPHPRGLLGHSDADVLTHAICDALLGALSEGDVGRHFPDSDAQYANIESLLLLGEVFNRVEEKGFGLVNIDATIVAQEPRLAPYIPRMEENIAEVLRMHKTRVNVKATTTEGLGFPGRHEGIGAYAVALLEIK